MVCTHINLHNYQSIKLSIKQVLNHYDVVHCSGRTALKFNYTIFSREIVKPILRKQKFEFKGSTFKVSTATYRQIFLASTLKVTDCYISLSAFVTKRSADCDRESIKSTLTARILVGFVLAVGFTVAEELLVHALAVTARQFPFGADWFVGPQDGQHLTRLCKCNPR